MHIFFVGVACVGKTTIGNRLASKIEFKFLDLDEEIERLFGKSIERIKTNIYPIILIGNKVPVY